MSIRDAIEAAIKHSSPPPMNELETCDRIIYPLLMAAGYAPTEIGSQRHVAGFPDYVLLPSDPTRRFYIEAKAWQCRIDANHERQALSYSMVQMSRWAVLTNGREWRLYDLHVVHGQPEDRLVLIGHIDDVASMQRFLGAISRESVLSGRIAEIALDVTVQRRAERDRQERKAILSQILGHQLGDRDSELVHWMCEVLKEHEGLGSLTRAELVEQLAYRPSVATITADPPDKVSFGVDSDRPSKWYPKLPPSQVEFWRSLLMLAEQRGVDTRGWRGGAAGNHNWLIVDYLRPGYSNIAFVRRRDSFGLDLYIYTGDRDLTARVYRLLEAERNRSRASSVTDFPGRRRMQAAACPIELSLVEWMTLRIPGQTLTKLSWIGCLDSDRF